MRKLIFVLYYFLLLCSYSRADQIWPADTIHIPYTNNPIEIDGSLNEWENYYLSTFSDTASVIHTGGNYSLSDVYPPGFQEKNIPKPLSRNKVVSALCWDEEALYLGMIVFDNHLIAEFIGEEDDPNIYLNDAIEFYIDTRNDSKERMDINDYQIIVDVRNQHCVFKGNLRLMDYDTLMVPKERGQNLLIQSAVTYHGFLNNQLPDGYFIIEIKIPFAAIGIIAKEGEIVRIDVCNDDADYLMKDLGVSKEDMFITWPYNWSGIGDFGIPETWKTAVLEGHPSLYKHLSEKYKYKWIYWLVILLLLAVVIFVLVYLRIKKLRNMPRQEIIKKYIIIENEEITPRPEGGNSALISNVSEYITQNISEKITPLVIAEVLNISLRTLQRLTKEELDCTPGILINLIKLQLAKEFLVSKKGNISEAAYKCGFSDPAYFSKLFKKQYGVSPKEFTDQNH